MSEERTEHSSSGIIGLIILVALGFWAYNTWFKEDISKPWFAGNEVVRLCASTSSSCASVTAVSTGNEITNVYVNGNVSESGVFQSYCSKDSLGRYCSIETRSGTSAIIRE